ncbi:ribonuclease P protein component [Candidatus Parcubacteria bacterium]|uniref:Ribonuclease P protein component n=1 Tax=Candidatus Kaiserbacteria bacterium CG10_big_fil_rev_8_21_14_0_10_47_16 TaxID=1974608 RepID=A0A2H0UG07_9BACT|nr:ribonuclease P protein component [Candidatus Parcubacteria bacterium]PIR84616.1 MAG: ribonuclease P protein component [Candidatus Kaiserbacteria bacterium CG10_big_fil_rev_8_21_14_0_10_47_16]
MLAKTERLTKSDFDRFFASGKRLHTPLFTLVCAPHNAFHGAVVVPKKILKSAVKRNKIRRQVYDILRRLARAQARTGVCIILLKKDAVGASYEDLSHAVSAAVGRIQNTR